MLNDLINVIKSILLDIFKNQTETKKRLLNFKSLLNFMLTKIFSSMIVDSCPVCPNYFPVFHGDRSLGLSGKIQIMGDNQ